MTQEIKNYAVYYGYNNVEKLKEYDLVIVEPNGQSVENISYLKKNNTITIAYLSILEINRDYPEFKYLKDEDFLTINGKRIINSEFNNFLVNLSSGRYVSMLIHKIGNLLLNKGFQGIFLDTVGDIEFGVISSKMKKNLIVELVKVLQTIKNMFPQCIIIQNNGANIIKHTVEYVDILMLENPNNIALGLSSGKDELVNYIINLKNNYRIKLFLLFEEKNIELYSYLYNEMNLVKEKNILFYLSNENYLDI